MSRGAGTDGPRNHEADPGTGVGVGVREKVHNDAAASSAAAAFHNGGELTRAAHPVGRGEHDGRRWRTRGRRRPQADSSRRPLRRRAPTMARPARVRIRSRKPCVLARRRLFGWKVRLLTVGLQNRRLHADELAKRRSGWSQGATCSPDLEASHAAENAAAQPSTVRIAPGTGQTRTGRGGRARTVRSRIKETNGLPPGSRKDTPKPIVVHHSTLLGSRTVPR
jgi:hypothetical protein